MQRLDHPARSCFYAHIEHAPALPRGAVSWQAQQQFVCRDSSLPPSQAHIWSSMSLAAARASEKAESKNSRGWAQAQNRELTYFDGGGKWAIDFGKAPGATSRTLAMQEFFVTGRDEPLCFECCPLTLRHAFQGKFRFDKTSCGRVSPADGDKCTGGFRKWDICTN